MTEAETSGSKRASATNLAKSKTASRSSLAKSKQGSTANIATASSTTGSARKSTQSSRANLTAASTEKPESSGTTTGTEAVVPSESQDPRSASGVPPSSGGGDQQGEESQQGREVAGGAEGQSGVARPETRDAAGVAAAAGLQDMMAFQEDEQQGPIQLEEGAFVDQLQNDTSSGGGAESAGEPDHVIYGDEIEVIPIVSRILASPTPDNVKDSTKAGFSFVVSSNYESDPVGVVGSSEAAEGAGKPTLGARDGIASETVVEGGAVGGVEKEWAAIGVMFDYLGDQPEGVADDGGATLTRPSTAAQTRIIPAPIATWKTRTPMLRPSSPTELEVSEEEKLAAAQKQAEDEEAAAAAAAAAAEAEVAGGIDREALIEQIKAALEAKEKLKNRNTVFQNKLSDYFRRKRTEETQDGEKSVADQEQRYANCMSALKTLRTEYEGLNSTNQKVVNEYKVKLEERNAEALEKTTEFTKFKRQVALGAENSRTGKPIPAKVVEQLEATEAKKDNDVVAVRLDHIKLRNKLKRHEQLLRQKEELADGLHLIDFEQLKIENQTYNEKIEERNEELLKLRKKITNIVQVLTHVKEKLQFVQGDNVNLKTELKDLEREVSVRRDSLPVAKHARDFLRNNNTTLRQKNGLLGNQPLLRDFEEKVDDATALQNKIDDLRTEHANLAAETLALKRRIQRKMIV